MFNKAQYAADQIKKIAGFKLYSDNRNFIKEFTVEQKFDAHKVKRAAEKENILFDSIGDKLLKFSFTEKRTKNDIDKLVLFLKNYNDK